MVKMNVQNVMKGSFYEIGNPELEAGIAAFNQFESEMLQLDKQGDLEVVDLVRAMYDCLDMMPRLVEWIGARALGEMVVKKDEQTDETGIPATAAFPFRHGFTAVVADESGDIVSFYHSPNESRELAKYGNQILYPMLLIGREKLARTHAKAHSYELKGYELVLKAREGKEIVDVPFAERHHLGGASIDVPNRYSNGEKLRGHPMRNWNSTYYAGVSGILLTDFGVDYLLNQHGGLRTGNQLQAMWDHAVAVNAHAGFDGNIFAGAMDTALAQLLLQRIHDLKESQSTFKSYIDMLSMGASIAIQANARGVNPH